MVDDKVLLIYAHPDTEGFCSTILGQVKEQLGEGNFRLIDLYKLGYDPVLKKEEHYTAGNDQVSAQNKSFQDDLSSFSRVVFIYPVWWNGPPAILKGFFDRVLVPGFAFRFEGRLPKKLLKGRKAAVFLTHGGPGFFTTFILRNRGAKVVVDDTLKFCGYNAKFFKISDARKLDDKRKKEIGSVVKKGLKFLMR